MPFTRAEMPCRLPLHPPSKEQSVITPSSIVRVTLREQVPFAFLYYQNTLYAYNNKVEGIKDVQDYSQQNRDVWNWTVTE